jgi:ABC-type multidrug transport system fused ATPase/permease subunit
MGIRTIVLLLVVALIAALAALNWGLIMTPATMSVGFTEVQQPFGLIMLALTALLGVVFIAYVIYQQSSMLLETRRHAREMQAQRDLVNTAEGSRFTELRSFLETQENARMASNAERHAALLACIEQLESAQKVRAEQLDNTLAAHIGQLEDRLERR